MKKSFYENISKILYKGYQKKVTQLHEPIFENSDFHYLEKCLKQGIVSSTGNAIFRNKFESEISKFTKSKFALATTNGVSALHACLMCLGVGKNHEVLVPSLTFVASVHSILYTGAVPHFIEASEDDLGVDPNKLEDYLNKITSFKKGNYYNKKTGRILKALMPVHVFGNACKIERLVRIAKRFKLAIVEDATEALGTFFEKKHVGTFGDMGALSFNGNKIITSGAGGMIISKSTKFQKRANHLISNAKIKHEWEYNHNEIGFNYRMTNLNAALGYAQFTRLKKILLKKKKNFDFYNNLFKENKDLSILNPPKNTISNYWLNTLVLKNKNINKDYLIQILHKYNIKARPIWKPLHTLKHLKKYPRMSLETTNKIYKKIICLPSGPNILAKNLEFIKNKEIKF